MPREALRDAMVTDLHVEEIADEETLTQRFIDRIHSKTKEAVGARVPSSWSRFVVPSSTSHPLVRLPTKGGRVHSSVMHVSCRHDTSIQCTGTIRGGISIRAVPSHEPLRHPAIRRAKTTPERQPIHSSNPSSPPKKYDAAYGETHG